MTVGQAVKPENDPIRVGVYRHYKHTDDDPKYYLIVGIGRFVPTEEKVVIYVPLYAAGGPRYAVRPLKDWIRPVERDGRLIPRFTFMGDEIEGLTIR